jgi:hypothetical protein
MQAGGLTDERRRRLRALFGRAQGRIRRARCFAAIRAGRLEREPLRSSALGVSLGRGQRSDPLNLPEVHPPDHVEELDS